jgi:hypothetical protein
MTQKQIERLVKIISNQIIALKKMRADLCFELAFEAAKPHIKPRKR